MNNSKHRNIIKRAKGINIFIKSKLKLTNKQLGISISYHVEIALFIHAAATQPLPPL